MPDNIRIAVFIFGAILLLIAVLGGGFKIFGAEVSGTTGRVGRSIAALFGVILVSLGIYGPIAFPELERDSSVGTSGSASSDATTPPQADVDRDAVPAPPVKCESGSGNASAGDKITNAAYVGMMPGEGLVTVKYEYDNRAHQGLVYIRVTALRGGKTVLAQGFARAVARSGVAQVTVQTIVKDSMSSEWIEVALCTEGHAIRVHGFPAAVAWLPSSD